MKFTKRILSLTLVFIIAFSCANSFSFAKSKTPKLDDKFYTLMESGVEYSVGGKTAIYENSAVSVYDDNGYQVYSQSCSNEAYATSKTLVIRDNNYYYWYYDVENNYGTDCKIPEEFGYSFLALYGKYLYFLKMDTQNPPGFARSLKRFNYEKDEREDFLITSGNGSEVYVEPAIYPAEEESVKGKYILLRDFATDVRNANIYLYDIKKNSYIVVDKAFHVDSFDGNTIEYEYLVSENPTEIEYRSYTIETEEYKSEKDTAENKAEEKESSDKDWKQAYIDYINDSSKHDYEDTVGESWYALVNITDDDIPELVHWHGSGRIHYTISTFNQKTNEIVTEAIYWTYQYKEKTGYFLETANQMGPYIMLYKVSSDSIGIVAEGSEPFTGDVSYMVDGENVTKGEFYSYVKMKSGIDVKDNLSAYCDNTEEHYGKEIIDIINNY